MAEDDLGMEETPTDFTTLFQQFLQKRQAGAEYRIPGAGMIVQKARKVEDTERLQYIITGFQDAALQWYLNQVQAYEHQQPFEGWNSFAEGIKTAFQPPHHQQLLHRQLRDLKQTTTVQEYAA
ncbi:1350_t:CDS:2, partial [Dentiscutata heterogama]